MIIFINFAPIQFMGGAEKWMNETAQTINKYESTLLLSVAPNIANLYGRLVLKRVFEKRVKGKTIHNNISLTVKSFIPFTLEWKRVRKSLQQARIIYAKYELLEILIILYFGGILALKKSIAGIHSPFLYKNPSSFFGRLHNRVYASVLSREILSHLKKIHVLTNKDKKIMTTQFKLPHVIHVPNGITMQQSKILPSQKKGKPLRLLFVGELSERKGVDVLIHVIKNSPENFMFTIVGDGPLQEEIKELSQKKRNCIYEGYVDEDKMADIYMRHDVLILPSRAESMSLAVLEALSYGLVIVDSLETSLGLGKNIEYICNNNDIYSYLSTLQRLFRSKKENQLDRGVIRKFFTKNFSSDIVYPRLFTNVFELRI